MRILITGGTGFIGAALAEALLKIGAEVTILTRSYRKAADIFQDRVGILEADIRDNTTLEKLDVKFKVIDVVIHLAATLEYFGHDSNLYSANVEGSANIISWSKKRGIKKVIFVSSVEAMGMALKDEPPMDETCVCRPASSYGISKLKSEEKAMDGLKDGCIEVSILRLGNVYGPGSEAFIVPIANDILGNGRLLGFLPAYKDRVLSLVYIDDIVDGILLAIDKCRSGETYILAADRHVTVGDLFSIIAEALGRKIYPARPFLISIIFLELRKLILKAFSRADLATYFIAGNRGRVDRIYSVKKAIKELGYSPNTPLKEGVIKTLAWARSIGLLRDTE